MPYDPRSALRKLLAGDTSAWGELWEELHHQGDVGTASYAAVPIIVHAQDAQRALDWNPFAIVGLIELCRLRDDNPSVPDRLQLSYRGALRRLAKVGREQLAATKDELLVRSILGVIALSAGAVPLARAALEYTDDELLEMLER